MIKALIFDFDGVIVDTEPLHYEGFLRVMKRFDYTMTYEHYKKNYLAFQDRDCFVGILKEIGIRYDEGLLNELIDEKRRWLFSRLNELQIEESGKETDAHVILTFEGVVDFIRCASRYYVLAIASGAQREEVETVVKRLGVIKYLSSIVTAGDYVKGKPDPEPYLVAIERLNELGNNLKNEECIGIEDSFFGVRSVKSAGMKCLAVTNSYSEEILREAGADLVVQKLTNSILPLNL